MQLFSTVIGAQLTQMVVGHWAGQHNWTAGHSSLVKLARSHTLKLTPQEP